MIVLISGKMGSGKTTAADHLVNNHKFKRMSLAGALKQDILDMDFPVEDVLNKPPWMRLLMQAYGQARRAVIPDYWIEILLSDMEDQIEDGVQHVVIDDVRFPNELIAVQEYAMVKNIKFKTVRLYCIGGPQHEHSNDSSETALDDYQDWDMIIQAKYGDIKALTGGLDVCLGL